ncbi:DUF6596 domain-containing protein [Altererythrobacter sp. ZODW24]|uniref:RNA polymerase sigma factor n=1 Tax=Altererythrobacter sp. ZODW24 TaxID=2185142 RepID=UPI0013B3871E|nr:DUF6596 domain-containing protein [Altererythrobacter sp. ZODW24]
MARLKSVRFTASLNNHRSLDIAVRGERLRIIAALAVHCGDLDLAEEAFAEACSRAAAETEPAADWPAWLYRVARNVVIDRKRRDVTARAHAAETANAPQEADMYATIIPDQRLALIFACCHPAIDATSRVALTLTTICGLTAKQVASAFLVAPAAMSQRLVRAKRKLAGAGILFEIPDARFWPGRLEAVLATIEIAYARGHGDASEMGEDAVYAAQTLELVELVANMLPGNAEVHALAASLHFSQARRPARLDTNGRMVPLSEQDPAKWDRKLLRRAKQHFAEMQPHGEESIRILQAKLQSLWCGRASLEAPPPWPEVLAIYNRLLCLSDSPFVQLNRSVALAEVEGPEAALKNVDKIPAKSVTGQAIYHAVRADLLARCHRLDEAETEYDRAITAQPNPVERAWLRTRRENLSP